ncbi:hypothetical protein [Streptomyces sp. V1I1]|uniref:hypothetical protein n=1 Tax=Streptomyces sp. V1I1 TaxID=3042272 RepID=UPI002788A80E|nr:hypothetical protein [Streptomyces sp. V1I1]MDQ0943800.1 hypothetical protein [Streptomyces sp. V1I1]
MGSPGRCAGTARGRAGHTLLLRGTSVALQGYYATRHYGTGAKARYSMGMWQGVGHVDDKDGRVPS